MNGPIFICGYPKSGTTLLSQMFTNMPDTHIDNELHLATLCLHMLDEIYTSGAIKTDTKDILSFRLRELAFNDFEKYLWLVRDFFQKLHTGYHHGWRWGNNCKPSIHYVKFLKRMFPKSEIIFMMRDPRDIWASIKHSKWPGQEYFSSLEYFKMKYRLVYDKSLVPEVKTLLFTDLLTDPQIGFNLIDRLFYPEYLEGTGKVYKLRTLPVMSQDEMVEDGIVRSRNQRYKTELPMEEIKDIEATFADIFEKYNNFEG
jgi:hypothetical protein